MVRAYQYHPAFDVYNCMFRMLRILTHGTIKSIEENKIKLLDFYFLFPGLVKNIRVKMEHIREKNAVSATGNPYNSGSVENQARHVFERIKPIQELALGQLEKIGIIRRDAHDVITLISKELPGEIAKKIERANIKTKELADFVCETLCCYDLSGTGGLKDRTGLMEFRYDAI